MLKYGSIGMAIAKRRVVSEVVVDYFMPFTGVRGAGSPAEGMVGGRTRVSDFCDGLMDSLETGWGDPVTPLVKGIVSEFTVLRRCLPREGGFLGVTFILDHHVEIKKETADQKSGTMRNEGPTLGRHRYVVRGVAEHNRLGLVSAVLTPKVTEIAVNGGSKGNPGSPGGTHSGVIIGAIPVGHICQGTDMLLKARCVFEGEYFITGVDIIGEADVKCGVTAYIYHGVLVGFKYVETVMVLKVPTCARKGMGMLISDLLAVLEHTIGIFEFLKILFSQVYMCGDQLLGEVSLTAIMKAFSYGVVKGLRCLARDI